MDVELIGGPYAGRQMHRPGAPVQNLYPGDSGDVWAWPHPLDTRGHYAPHPGAAVDGLPLPMRWVPPAGEGAPSVSASHQAQVDVALAYRAGAGRCPECSRLRRDVNASAARTDAELAAAYGRATDHIGSAHPMHAPS
jgi:hypothetical protein